VNRKVHAGFGPADEGSTIRKLAASASSDWHVRREARFVYDAKVHLPLVVERQVYPPNLWAEQLAGQG
jgi:hypothetical protein